MLTSSAITMLEARDIDPEQAARLGVDVQQQRGGEVIVFPYRRAGNTVNHKYRAIDEKKFWQDADGEKLFWNFDALLDESLRNETLIITEGEFDALVALQCGYQATISVPDGAPATAVSDTSVKFSYLDAAMPLLRDRKDIILATDGDNAGTVLREELARRIGRARCRWVKYPPATKDLNEVLMRYGAEGVHKCLRSAQYMRVDGVYRMSELRPLPEPVAYTTGIKALDAHFRVRMGDLSVLTGIPGMGKTTLVNDIACRLATEHEWMIAFASFEQSPQADHRRALRQWHIGKAFKYSKPEEIENADAWIDKQFCFIVPSDDDFPTVDWMLERAAAAVVQLGAKVLFIDPWNEIEHEKPRDQSMTEYTGTAIRSLKRFARKFDVHVCVVAHPTKLHRDTKGKLPVPSLYDISDSAHWANKPDAGIVVHRDDNGTMVKVAKSRYHDSIGKPGVVWLTLNEMDLRFNEAVAWDRD